MGERNLLVEYAEYTATHTNCSPYTLEKMARSRKDDDGPWNTIKKVGLGLTGLAALTGYGAYKTVASVPKAIHAGGEFLRGAGVHARIG